MFSLLSALCPWSGFKPSEIDFCENNLCAWIVEPANSWSCIAYVLVGLFILSISFKNRLARPSVYFGYIAILIGLFSLAYHASLTFIGSLLDLGSMYLLLSNIIYIIIERLSVRLNRDRIRFSGLMFWAFNLILLVVTFLFESITGILYLGLVVSVLAMEIFLLFLERGMKKKYYWLLITFSLYVVSSCFWYIDTYRVYCAPDNHWVNGHVLWHFGSAICVFTVFMHYRQFYDDKKN